MVFRATDQQTPRTVALKVYWPAMFADETAQARFLRAMRVMVPLSHPHVVKLHAAGRSRGLCFTASEYVEGESTADLIGRLGIAGMLDWTVVWRMARHLASGLDYLHARSIVHRSVVPSNMLIRARDRVVKLGDSMLAKALDDGGSQALTKRGEVVGDIYYLAPEQITATSPPDPRSDLYGLGATLYALLTGRPPFMGIPAEVSAQILSTPPAPPTQHHLAIPADIEGVVLRLMAKRPEDRYPTASRLLVDLETIGLNHDLRVS
jgi:serine/threonine-protein kinase